MTNNKLAFIALAILMTGCSPFKSNPGPMLDASFFSAGDASLIPASDKLVMDCAARADFDTCIFLKNPSAQNQTVVGFESLQANRRFGVKLRALHKSGKLENAKIEVLTLHTTPFSLFNSNHRRAPITDEDSFTEQLMAYYWANRAFEYLGPRLGEELLPKRRLKIYVDDRFTGYSAQNHSIHLEKRPGLVSKAFNAEVILQLLGQAIAQELSGDAVFSKTISAQHKYCSLDPKGCCTSANGCAGSLASALGDYLAAVIFPAQPRLGETLAADLNGMKLCGFARDPAQLISKTKAEAFAACAQSTGRVSLVGAWYASVWWSLRAQAESLDGARDIDILFFQNSKAWTASSTFTESKAKALESAQSYRSGRYLALMQKVFNEAGL